MTPHVRCETEGPCLVITLERPEKLNALTTAMVQGIRDGLKRAAEDPLVRVVILTGGEKVFCAGADIGIEKGATPLEFRRFVQQIQDITRDIQTLDKMVIAAVSGYALGGGAEIALACDLRVFSESATFGFPEVGLGLTITSGASYLLPRTVGLGRAKEIALLGRRVEAAEAEALGLANRVVPVESMLTAAKELAGQVAGLPPHAVAAQKQLLNAGVEVSLEALLRHETEAIAAAIRTEDAQEGMIAFLEKRAPKFGSR